MIINYYHVANLMLWRACLLCCLIDIENADSLIHPFMACPAGYEVTLAMDRDDIQQTIDKSYEDKKQVNMSLEESDDLVAWFEINVDKLNDYANAVESQKYSISTYVNSNIHLRQPRPSQRHNYM